MADNGRYDDIHAVSMPKTIARFRDRAHCVNFRQFRAEMPYCQPDRCAALNGLYGHNHKNTSNTTGNYYDYMAEGHQSGGGGFWTGPWENEVMTGRLVKTSITGGWVTVAGVPGHIAFTKPVTSWSSAEYPVGSHIITSGFSNPLLNGHFKVSSLSGFTMFVTAYGVGASYSESSIGTLMEDWMYSSGSLPNWLKVPKDVDSNPLGALNWVGEAIEGEILTAFFGKYQNGYADAGSTADALPHLHVPAGWDYWFGINGDEGVSYNGGIDDEYHTRAAVGSYVTAANTRGVGSEEYYEYLTNCTSATWASNRITIVVGYKHNCIVGDRVDLDLTVPSGYRTAYKVDQVISDYSLRLEAFAGGNITSLGAITTAGRAYLYGAHQEILMARKAAAWITERRADEPWLMWFCPHAPATDAGNGNNRMTNYQNTISPKEYARTQGVSPSIDGKVTSYSYNAGTGKTTINFTGPAPTSGTAFGVGDTFWLANLAGQPTILPTPTFDPTTETYYTITDTDGTSYVKFAGALSPNSGGAGGNILGSLWDSSGSYQIRMELLKALDDAVEILDQALEAKGWAGTTVVFFFSDNGSLYYEHGEAGIKLDYGYEGMVHLPMYMRHPGMGAQSVDRLMVTQDLPLTVLDIFGLTTHYAHTTRDGLSFLRAMDSTNPYYNRSTYHNGSIGDSCVRQDLYKYMNPGFRGGADLYDLTTDPGENTDISGANPSITGPMQTTLTALQTCSGETCRTA